CSHYQSSLPHILRPDATLFPYTTLFRSRKRILVVDDEASIRDLVTTALEFVGYDVRSAADGYACLTAVSEDSPDLIVLDVNMPGDRKSTRLNSSHVKTSYAVFCLKKIR